MEGRPSGRLWTGSLRARPKRNSKPVKAPPSPVAMPNYVERFAWRGRDEETGDMVQFGVADAITFGGLARVHARSADFIGYTEEIELVGRLGLLEQRTHPSS